MTFENALANTPSRHTVTVHMRSEISEMIRRRKGLGMWFLCQRNGKNKKNKKANFSV